MKAVSTFVIVVSCVAAISRAEPRRYIQPPTNEQLYGLLYGKNATISKYPYTVAILTKYNELLGGGMIYKQQWIVTSGNVGNATLVSNMTVRVGSDNALDGGQLFNVSKVFYPPLYKYCTALIKLNKKIRFSKTAKPIKIANVSPGSGSIGYVTGYGESYDRLYKLQRRSSTIYDGDTCRDQWWTSVGMWMGPLDICATGSSCYGDNGNPLVYQGRAVGIFRRDVICIYVDVPVIYCELAKFRKWIDITIRENTKLKCDDTIIGAHGFGNQKTDDDSLDDESNDEANDDVDEDEQ